MNCITKEENTKGKRYLIGPSSGLRQITMRFMLHMDLILIRTNILCYTKSQGEKCMDKEQIADKLTEMGYNAVLENGVIMCTLASEKAARGLKKTLKELSYNGSWGYRIRKDVQNEAETVCSGENSDEILDNGDAKRNVVLPHEELSEHSGFREHREQAESNGSLQDDESECESLADEQIDGQMSIMDLLG